MILSIIIFIITLLVLVILHELGHLIVAKKFGIKVLEFGFGIPPRIWGKRIGETLYSINWLPFGGFVKLLGEDDAKGVQSQRDFRAKPVGVRLGVVVAGVVMNLFLAWVLFYTVIISQNFQVIYPSELGIYIAEVEEDFPAAEAGLKAGEKLLKIDDQKVPSSNDIGADIKETRKIIRSKDIVPIALTLADSDGNNQRIVNVIPKKIENNDVLIGVVFSPFPYRKYASLSEKIFSGVTYSGDLTRITFAGFSRIVQDLVRGNFGQISKSVSGPVGIASTAKDILSLGWESVLPYLWFMGVISLTLCIFNVLPIPALDGGRLLFLVIEAVTRRKIREDVERWVHQIGFLILIMLALLITYSDIRKMLP